ncbi:MAG: hypothetical protein ABIJ41_01290 [Candidatus Omnitrophota bacterium]
MLIKNRNTMESSPFQFILKKRQAFFLALVSAVILLNLVGLGRKIFSREKIFILPSVFNFPGFQFSGLKDDLRDVPYVGYFTDKDLDVPLYAAQFQQAQLILAPTVLDLNNTGHEYIIFDCTTPQIAFRKMKELHVQPLKINPLGAVLGQKAK